ncbi:MAG TPA: hypothetical protein VFU14_05425 [Acidimicrobiales bacterium]|nr:hypothetical protein [Acidimicrobiales bacterium]
MRSAPPASREAARRRHPSTHSPVAGGALRGCVAAVVGRTGAAHPEVAASVLAVRGRSGLDPEVFARRAGVALDVLLAAEAGDLGRDELPGALRRMVPQPDGPAPGQKFSSL